jgi:hypothetical protein
MRLQKVIMNTEKEYYIERLNADKLVDMARLHLAVYHKAIPVSFFEKKYDTAFTGAAYVGYIAYSTGGVPVAYYGVIPCFLQDGSKLIPAAQSADTMTHPQYRFKGLFVELSRMTFELCRQENIRIIFGFPNQNSLHGAINKLGWQMTHTMDCFIVPVRTIPLEKIARNRFLLRDLYRLYIKKVLAGYRINDSVENSVIQQGYIGVCRNNDYWIYKQYHERYVIRINNALLWIRITNGLMIGDITGCADVDGVMTTLKEIAVKLGLTQLQFHASPGGRLHDQLVKKWNPVPSFPALVQDFGSGCEAGRIRFNFADIDIF